ncbi:MAG: site-specific integrase, partial [Pseudomonadota bacterium]|nr:site-specific integrase [Pseudomonadota bacterium]
MKINLKSKSGRAALAPRREPYWACVRIGLYLGLRRSAEGDGTWIGRMLRVDAGGLKGSKAYVTRPLGAPMGHDEALDALNAWASGVDLGATHKATSVQEACRQYVEHQKTHASKANAADARGRFARLVDESAMGRIHLDKLRTPHLNAWLKEQLDEDGDEEDLRRSKDTANRNLTAAKAALNLALRNRLVATDAGWKTVTPFPRAGRRRDRFLT